MPSTDPIIYARRLLDVCIFHPTPESWGAANARELRAVVAALLADREQPGVVLRFENGQATGWDRPVMACPVSATPSTDQHGPHED